MKGVAVPFDSGSTFRIEIFTDSMANACEQVVRASVEASHGEFYTPDQIVSLLKDYSAERFRTKSKERKIFIARASNGEIVAFGSIKEHQIKAIYVDPSYMGQGVGSLLLHHLQLSASEAGNFQLELLSSLNAVGFYERHGFISVHQNTDINGPAVFMRKSLNG